MPYQLNIYYQLAGETEIPLHEDEESDSSCLKRGMITITPICFDLTRHDLLDGLKARARGCFPDK